MIQLQDLQFGQLVQLGRDGARQLIIVEPQTTEVGQVSHLGRNGSRESGIGQGDRGKLGQKAKFGRKCSSDSIAVQPHCDCQYKQTGKQASRKEKI